jgi:hypothetical protein
MVCSNTGAGTIQSLVDAELRVKEYAFSTLYTKTDALMANGFINRVAKVLFIDNMSVSIPDETRLSNLLKKMRITKEQKSPIGCFTRRVSEDSTSFLQLSMRVPELTPENTGAWDNLALLIKFASAVTGADLQKVRVIQDSSLGNTVLLPAFHQKLLNEITVAASHSQGVCTSAVYKIKEGYEANPVEMLGLLKVLNANYYLCRKAPARKDKITNTLQSSEVREAFNLHCGLKTAKSDWVLQFITEALAFAVRPTTESFPGCFIHAAKERMKVKSSQALLQTCGWVPIVPHTVRGHTIVYNKVAEKDGKKSLFRLPEDSMLDFPEHRTLVALALPKINPESSVTFEDQLKKDPMSHIWNKSQLTVYASKGYIEFLDAVNTAYNIHTACHDPKGKATAAHFEQIRGLVLRKSANLPLVDARGISYASFKELPDNIRKFFLRKYQWKAGASKRARSPEQSGEKVSFMEVEVQLPTTVSQTAEPPAKKQHLDGAGGSRPSFKSDLARTVNDPRVSAIAPALVSKSWTRKNTRRGIAATRASGRGRGRGGSST